MELKGKLILVTVLPTTSPPGGSVEEQRPAGRAEHKLSEPVCSSAITLFPFLLRKHVPNQSCPSNLYTRKTTTHEAKL